MIAIGEDSGKQDEACKSKPGVHYRRKREHGMEVRRSNEYL